MTVIAGVVTEAGVIVAADTRVLKSDGSVYPTAKLRRVRGGIVGASGDDDAVQEFLDWQVAGGDINQRPYFRKGADFEGLLVTPREITEFGGRAPWPDVVRRQFHAIGSGAQGALAVMAYQAQHLYPLDPRAAIAATCSINADCARPIDVMQIRPRRAKQER